MAKHADESHITLAQSRALGGIGKALSEAMITMAEEFVEEEEMQHPNSRNAAVFTILEALIFLTLTEMLEPEERAPVLRLISIGTRKSLAHYHQDTGQ